MYTWDKLTSILTFSQLQLSSPSLFKNPSNLELKVSLQTEN